MQDTNFRYPGLKALGRKNPAMRLKTQLVSLIGRHMRVRPARLAGRRPVASISFDDFPKSAWTLGGPVLARHGVRGTYYTGGSFCGQTVKETRSLWFAKLRLKSLRAAEARRRADANAVWETVDA